MAIVDYCTPISDLQPLFGVAVALSFSVIAFLFLLGRALVKSEWEAVARKELNEIIIAALIALAVVGLAGISCEATRAILSDYAPGHTQFTYSYEYFDKLINNMGIPSVQSLWTVSYLMKNFKSETPLGGPLKLNWFALANAYGVILDRLTGIVFNMFIGSLHAQLILLQMSQAFAITLILPVGVVLRAIPFTRSGGSFLIALAFGLYIVLPLMYVINYDISSKVWPGFDQYMVESNSLTVTDEISSFISRIVVPIQTLTKIIPQASVLAVLNLTIFQSFVEMFSKFLDDLG